jgi:hypothetical protein
MESTSKMLKSLENLFVSHNKFSGGVHTSKPKKQKKLAIFKSKMHKPTNVRAYVYERRIHAVPSRVAKDDDFVSAFLNMTVNPKKKTRQAKVKKTVVSRPTKMKTEGLLDDIDFIVKSFNKVKVSSKVTKKPKREGTRKSARTRNKPQRLNPSAPLKGKKKSSKKSPSKKSPSKKSSSNKSSKNSSSSRSGNSMMMFF